MSVIYKKIQQIIGPLIFVKNEHNVKYGEIVEIQSKDGNSRIGQITKITQDLILIEVFEDTTGLSSENSQIIFTDDAF